MQKMEYKWIVPFTILAFILVLVNCDNSYYRLRYVPKPCTLCNTRGGPCCMLMEEGEGICCSGSVSQNVKYTQFNSITERAVASRGPVFNRTYQKPSPWSIEFWNYTSFIAAAAQYQPYGFGTTYKDGGKVSLGKMEVAALLAHIGSKVTCDDNVSVYERVTTCGLCNYKEKNTSFPYCDENYKDNYPCAPGVAYYGRGALPIYWNYNYGEATKDLNVDLLKHPEYIENNATLAFLVAIWRWMTPIKENQPSAHDVFIGNWKPTENENLANRVPGFGTTMNVLYGDLVCGKGNNETSMNNIIDYYRHYLDRIGVNPNEAGPQELLSCADQVPFNPSVALPP
ncbi:chitinase-like protein 2 [Quercus robur]|uniref:chitinase-like protein 2 n=1 Tax=Quercus robur TaxID=38942 RepID=UPI002161DA15|nr:chitinase-like protein 2 [Quercus robur]